MLFTSQFADVEIPELSITEFVFANAAAFADKLAFVDGPSGRSYTYAQLQGLIAKVPCAFSCFLVRALTNALVRWRP
jgi:hypothetical protein